MNAKTWQFDFKRVRTTFMGESCLLKLVTVMVLATSTMGVNAALYSRLGGMAYYDDVLDITWLEDSNLAATNTFGVSGINSSGNMDWNTSQAWITAMNTYNGGAGWLGLNNWRLPLTGQPDATCSRQYVVSGYPNQGYGYNCTGSEMGHLYNVDVVTPGSPQPFDSVVNNDYWSHTEYAPNTGEAWNMSFQSGYQNKYSKSVVAYAWAVRPGDVPVPATGWLFGSGLLALIHIARKGKAG